MTNNTDRKTEKKAYIPGIECTVTNCLFNDDKRNCYASKIQVGPMNAHSDDQTKCATFKKKPSDNEVF